MPANKEVLTVRSLDVEHELLSKTAALWRRQNTCKVLSDMRVLSGHMPHWVEPLLGFLMPKKDGKKIVIPADAPVARASIRCFNEGNIHFQRPMRTGVFRDEMFNQNDLISDIERISFYVLVDARRLPRIDLYTVRADKILNYAYSRELTLSGMSPQYFDRFIRENFVTKFPDIDGDGYVITRRRLRAKNSVKFLPGAPVILQVAR